MVRWSRSNALGHIAGTFCCTFGHLGRAPLCAADHASWIPTGSVLGAECLKIKPGMEKLASRFETRRYLALLGGLHPPPIPSAWYRKRNCKQLCLKRMRLACNADSTTTTVGF
jgi:hypothetical protein